MGGRGGSSASGKASVKKMRNFLSSEGFSVVLSLQSSSSSGDFDEAWANLMYGRGYPTDYARNNRKSYNATKAKAKSAISTFMSENSMSLEDLRGAIKKNWS